MAADKQQTVFTFLTVEEMEWEKRRKLSQFISCAAPILLNRLLSECKLLHRGGMVYRQESMEQIRLLNKLRELFIGDVICI